MKSLPRLNRSFPTRGIDVSSIYNINLQGAVHIIVNNHQQLPLIRNQEKGEQVHAFSRLAFRQCFCFTRMKTVKLADPAEPSKSFHF